MAKLLMIFLAFGSATVLGQIQIEDKEFWFSEGRTSLNVALKKSRNLNMAKNVIFFVGDGMGIPTVTASRIFREQNLGHSGEEGYLSWDTFPDVGLIKTYNVDKQVPDSAGTATAMFTGAKTKYKIIGLDATVSAGVCDATLLSSAQVPSLISWAQEAGKETGIVTTTRITHATPASLYAHTFHRDWECDSKIPAEHKDCVKDIARQLVEDAPGKNIKVVFGGGLHQFGVAESPDESSCKRDDKQNLADVWKTYKQEQGLNATFIRTTQELMDLKATNDQHVLGLFGYGHMDYNAERNRDPEGTPSIVNMTVKAIEMLQNSQHGFFLMVEGGRIDHAHHDNYAKLSLLEAEQLDAAVSAALERTSRSDTLIIVTADHSHAMTINGYPERGNDILGFAHSDAGKPVYETLTYSNGPGFDYHRKKGAITEDQYLWEDLSSDTTRNDLRYQHFAPIFEDDETHGGEDVAIYAIGPFSHLFTGVHEQSYIAHAISCAGDFGPDKGVCISAAPRVAMTRVSALIITLLAVINSLLR